MAHHSATVVTHVPESTRAREAPGGARRLLVITYHFPPEAAVGGLRWAGITKHLARLGWQVAVMTAAPSTGTGPASGAHVEFCPRGRTLIDGFRLLRGLILRRSRLLPATRGGRPSEPASLLHRLRREITVLLTFPDVGRGWMLRATLRTRRLIRRFEPHVVVSSGPPHSAHLVARMAILGNPVRWLIDLRDPWAGPFTKAWASHPRWGSRMYRALSARLERRVFRAADGVITNTKQLADALAVRYPDVRVTCVPNGVDPEGLPPPAPHPLPGLAVVYAGTLYGSRDLGPVVRALRIFFGRHPEAAHAGSKLRIAGEVDARRARELEDAVAAAGIEPYVEMLGPLPRAEALNVVSRSRLAVVLAQDQGLQVPAKLYETVAMGIPTLVLTEAGSAAGLEGERVGALVRDPTDVEGIAGILDQLWQEDARSRPACPVPITYDAIAPLVDQLLGDTVAAGVRPRARYSARRGGRS